MTQIDVLTSPEELRAIEPAWRELGARFPTPLLQYDWFLSCAEALYPAGDLRVTVLSEGSRVTAIAPLARQSRPYSVWLETMGSSHLHEPTDWLYEDSAALTKVLQSVARIGYPLDLGRLPADSPMTLETKALISTQGLWLKRPSGIRNVLDLTSGWDSIQAAMSKSRRTDFRRLKRRAAEHGGFQVEILAPSPDDVDIILEQAMNIEASGWKGAKGSALKNKPLLSNFFHRYCRRMAYSRKLVVFFLRLAGIPVAMHLAVTYANALWILKIGYKEDFRSLSPGLYLALKSIQHAVKVGLDRYEFLGSDEAWQRMWPIHPLDHQTRIYIPYTYRGVRGALEMAFARLERITGSGVYRLGPRRAHGTPFSRIPFNP